jgi:peptidyl-tRNA hydrolase
MHPGADPGGAWRERQVIAVRDAGFTEVAPGTVTVLAQWRV